jgi:hypothetical protein
MPRITFFTKEERSKMENYNEYGQPRSITIAEAMTEKPSTNKSVFPSKVFATDEYIQQVERKNNDQYIIKKHFCCHNSQRWDRKKNIEDINNHDESNHGFEL